jgi:glycosyltransferase involved in cell wall biosynthesis
MSRSERAVLPVRPFFSPADARAVGALIDEQRTQVLHLHNPYPLISPAVIRTAKRRGVAVVQTVHNYRHTCLNGYHLRDGAPCTQCVGRMPPLPAIRHACYRGSTVQSVALAGAEWAHQKAWHQVDRFLVLSQFMADQLAGGGFDPTRIVVKPNYVDDPGAAPTAGEGFLFAGRLDTPKGVELLLEAWERSGLDGRLPLTIAGDGELRGLVEDAVARNRTLRYAGPLDREQIAAAFRAARTIVVPSVWAEGLPTVILEAFANGRSVVASRLGSLVETVTPDVGWLADPDPADLARVLVDAAEDQGKGDAARARYLDLYTPAAVLERQLAIYRSLAA